MQVLLNYRPDWAKGKNYPCFTDHGVAAAVSLLKLRALIREAPDQLAAEAPELSQALRICRHGGAGLHDVECDFVAKRLLPVAIQAIALHNLYPRHLPPPYSSYRTSLHESSFDFLAMLADTLQDWDRRYLANLGKAVPPQVVSADDFDLRVKGNHILIYQQGTQNILERSQKLKGLLDQYLRNASSLVRLSLSEYRVEPR
jgi:hypothetical protein